MQEDYWNTAGIITTSTTLVIHRQFKQLPNYVNPPAERLLEEQGTVPNGPTFAHLEVKLTV